MHQREANYSFPSSTWALPFSSKFSETQLPAPSQQQFIVKLPHSISFMLQKELGVWGKSRL